MAFVVVGVDVVLRVAVEEDEAGAEGSGGVDVCDWEGCFGLREGGREVVEIFARGGFCKSGLEFEDIDRWNYQVRRRQVRSLGGQEERIREWISGGKELKSANVEMDMILVRRGDCVGI